MPGPARRILVVEDHPLTRTLLTETLTHHGFEVTAVGSTEEAIAVFEAADPDVLLSDVDLGSRPNGVELATLLFAQAPHLAIVLVSNYGSLNQITGQKLLPRSARFASKLALTNADLLLDVVEAALRERKEPTTLRPHNDSDQLKGLTAAQLDVLRLIAEGWSNQEIAKRRGTHVGAIEKIISRMLHTLGLADQSSINPRVSAARLYIQTFGPPAPTVEP